MYDVGGMIIGGITMLISTLVSARLKSKFNHYSNLRLRNNLSGREIAEKMLHDNGITDVKVVSVAGRLTDHYNPANKTVNLSEAVYNEINAAAAAVAAHEVGHAVQHANAYNWLTMRSKLVPVVNISSRFMQWVILAGIMMVTKFPYLLGVGILLFAMTTLFSFITLPVEFDASRRALAWMEDRHIVTREEHAGAKDALKWAAMTYVVAAVGSLATLIHYILLFMNRSRQ
jgi:uncharacterized protein